MAFKVYLSPSNQPKNTYNGVNVNERDNCRAIANKVKVALERCGIDVKIGLKGSSNVSESNSWGANLHLPIHTNAANKKARGAVVLVHSKAATNMKYAQPIFNELKAIVLKQDTGRDFSIRKDLSEISQTTAICAYVEVDFHDVPEVAKWLTTEHDLIAEAICKGVCKGAGITYKAPKAATPAKDYTAAANEVFNGLKGKGYTNTEIKQITAKLGELCGSTTPATTTPKTKTITEIAEECINGLWGNGTPRRTKLVAAGYNYDQVQAEVNRILKERSAKK